MTLEQIGLVITFIVAVGSLLVNWAQARNTVKGREFEGLLGLVQCLEVRLSATQEDLRAAEVRIDELETENQELRARVAELEAENQELKDRRPA